MNSTFKDNTIYPELIHIEQNETLNPYCNCKVISIFINDCETRAIQKIKDTYKNANAIFKIPIIGNLSNMYGYNIPWDDCSFTLFNFIWFDYPINIEFDISKYIDECIYDFNKMDKNHHHIILNLDATRNRFQLNLIPVNMNKRIGKNEKKLTTKINSESFDFIKFYNIQINEGESKTVKNLLKSKSDIAEYLNMSLND